MGLYSDSLERRLRMDPVVRKLCELQFGWPTVGVAVPDDPNDGSFKQIATLEAASSGANWITPFGIPFPHGVPGDGFARNVPASAKNNIVAEYPVGSGNYFPVSTEQYRYRNDGKLIHCTGHLKTPSGYVAREKINIGVMTSYTQPTAPNWGTLTAGGANIKVKLTIIEPRIFYMSLTATPRAGDKIVLTITDAIGTLTYSHIWTFADDATYNGYIQALWAILAKNITDGKSDEGTASRYRCYDRSPVNPIPHKVMGEYDNLKQNPNTWPSNWMGVTFNSSGQSHIIPRTSLTTGGGRWPGSLNGCYIWPKDNGGEPEDFTLNAQIIPGKKVTVSTPSVAFSATHILNYNNQTVAWPGAGWAIWGKTSRNLGTIVADADGGSTGTLTLTNVTGPFLDGEDLCLEGVQTVYAKANGASVRCTVTASGSGATGKIAAINGNDLYLADTSGTMGSGNTLTSNGGGTAVWASTAADNSIAIYTTNAGATTTNGLLTPVQSKTNGVVYTAAFDDATATLDSPWFDTPQVYQEERRGIPKTAGNTPHPTLTVLFHLSRDSTGAKIFTRATVENSKIYGGAGDHFYHAEILIDDVSQTTGQAQYRMLTHNLWESWSWRSNYVFGCCNPGHFMKARIFPPWFREPTVDRRHEMAYKVRGGNSIDAIPISTALAETSGAAGLYGGQAWNGYVKAGLNYPLYSGGMDQGPTGGARPEVGAWFVLEWLAVSFDTIVNWESLEAAADNVAGAWGFNMRNETKTADDEEYHMPLHVYKQWSMRDPGNSSGAGWVISAPLHGGVGDNNANFNCTHLWSLRQLMQVQTDHAGRYPGFTAYLLRPDKRYLDHQEDWGTTLIQQLGTNGTSLAPPKTGGAVYDADHVLGYVVGNGNRCLSWAALETWRTTFLCAFEGARRYSYWKRASGDWKKHVDLIHDRTIFGFFHTCFRETGVDTNAWIQGFNSDNWNGPWKSYTPGNSIKAIECNVANRLVEDYGGSYVTNWEAQGLNTNQWGTYNVVDNFKELYVSLAMMCGHEWGVVDLQGALNRKTWPAKLLWAMPDGEWTRGLGSQATPLTSNLIWPSRGVFGSTDGTWPIWSDETMQGFKDFLAAASRPTQNSYYGLGQYVANGWDMFRGKLKGLGEERSPDTYGWACNYSYEATHMTAVVMGERHSTDSTYRALCRTYIDKWRTEFPPDTAITAYGAVARGIGTLSRTLMSTGVIDPETISVA